MAARERVEALTIYDSTSRCETLLSGHDVTSIRASSRAGAIFTLTMVVLAAVTCFFL